MIFLDGAMGTQLQLLGAKPGENTELLNLSRPDWIMRIHESYLEAGSEVIYANTFGANRRKLAGTGHSVQEVIRAALESAKKEAGRYGAKAALDIGPIGALLEPLGTLSFEEAYDIFAEMVAAGAESGADLIMIETMTDLYEAKAALLAAKECSDLPVWVTMSFDESGRTFTGCTVQSMAHTLEGLGADAIGINCSLGPDKLLPLIRELCENTSLPVIAKPNAGLPDPTDGHYDMEPEEFAAAMKDLVLAGASMIGGCCGTGPEYIRVLKSAVSKLPDASCETRKKETGHSGFVCTPTIPLRLDRIRVIGERINPTGKKRLQQALLENDLDYIVDVAVAEMDAGADILDVNVGYPGVDETVMLPAVVKAIQAAVDLPLQLDTTNLRALEAALRVYNGKAAVNSVNGKEESLQSVLPLVKKYGASVVGLTLDEDGIPDTAEKRFKIAERILDRALSLGIPKEDVWIDCLTLTVSAQQEQASETLKAVEMVSRQLGLQTVLGVSNISFGLPERILITKTFLNAALQAGLTLPIINPNQTEIMDSIAAFRVLKGEDVQSKEYIERFAQAETKPQQTARSTMTLEDAILRGLKNEAGKLAKEALAVQDEMEIVEKRLIPALDRVGTDYEKGIVFLPQLLSAAAAAQSVFEVIKEAMLQKGTQKVSKGRLIIATVQGDIHDIGKNIVKTVLENYGYDVLDLGKDVAPETIVKAVLDEKIQMVGLSALMTTTLPAMEETIRQLGCLEQRPVVFVGGAVLTPEYAKRIGADYYAKDARAAVAIAREVLG